MDAKQHSGASEWVDPDDAPELDDAFFDNATWTKGGEPIPTPARRGRPKLDRPKRQVTLRLDQDILDHFKAAGPGWQSRLNEALRSTFRR